MAPSAAAKPPKLPLSDQLKPPDAPSERTAVIPASPSYGTLPPASSHPRPVKPLPLPLPPVRRAARRARQGAISASTSFFGLPFDFSSTSLRSALRYAPLPGEIDWMSICVIYWVTLVSEASRGLMLPSTWPYLQSLGGTKSQLGLFVASFSVGRMLTTVPLGYLSDNYSTSIVLSVASFIQVLGHIAYAMSPTLPVLFASRIVVGFGSATMSVCRAHLTRSVPSSLRTHHFAYLSALQFIGFAVLPGLGGVLAMLPEYEPFSFMPLNGFTYPAYMLVGCNFLSMLLIYSFYLDPQQSQRSGQSMASYEAMEDGDAPAPQADVVALVICLLVNVIFRGVIAEFETVSLPFLMEIYGLSYGSSSYRIATIGFFGLFIYVGFRPIAKRFSDRSLVLFGLVAVCFGCIPLAWTRVTEVLPLPFYVLFLSVTWSVAYPVGQTAVLALFSKVLAGLPAGGFLGIFSATGSVARVLFAILGGAIWSNFGRESVFAVIVAYIVIGTLPVLIYYNRLVPCENGETSDRSLLSSSDESPGRSPAAGVPPLNSPS